MPACTAESQEKPLTIGGWTRSLPTDVEASASFVARTARELEDLVNVLERGGLLDLGDDVGPRVHGHTLGVHQVDELLDVLRLLREGEGNVVDAHREEVRGVLRRREGAITAG